MRDPFAPDRGKIKARRVKHSPTHSDGVRIPDLPDDLQDAAEAIFKPKSKAKQKEQEMPGLSRGEAAKREQRTVRKWFEGMAGMLNLKSSTMMQESLGSSGLELEAYIEDYQDNMSQALGDAAEQARDLKEDSDAMQNVLEDLAQMFEDAGVEINNSEKMDPAQMHSEITQDMLDRAAEQVQQALSATPKGSEKDDEQSSSKREQDEKVSNIVNTLAEMTKEVTTALEHIAAFLAVPKGDISFLHETVDTLAIVTDRLTDLGDSLPGLCTGPLDGGLIYLASMCDNAEAGVERMASDLHDGLTDLQIKSGMTNLRTVFATLGECLDLIDKIDLSVVEQNVSGDVAGDMLEIYLETFSDASILDMRDCEQDQTMEGFKAHDGETFSTAHDVLDALPSSRTKPSSVDAAMLASHEATFHLLQQYSASGKIPLFLHRSANNPVLRAGEQWQKAREAAMMVYIEAATHGCKENATSEGSEQTTENETSTEGNDDMVELTQPRVGGTQSNSEAAQMHREVKSLSMKLKASEAQRRDLASQMEQLAKAKLGNHIIIEDRAKKKVTKVEGLVHFQQETLMKLMSARNHEGKAFNILITGEMGGGKSSAVSLAAKLLGLSDTYIGQIDQGYQLVGHLPTDSDEYRHTEFTRAWINGGVCRWEEFDSWSPRAPMVANSPLADGVLVLENGERYERHKDCVIVACANTWGTGATMEYVGRNRLDGALLDRFQLKLHWKYDEDLERKIVQDDEVVDLIMHVREALEKNNIRISVSPRTSISVKALKDQGFDLGTALQMTALASMDPRAINTTVLKGTEYSV